MRNEIAVPAREKGADRGNRGSALLLAIFVLVMLAGMGFVLMNLSRNEMKMSAANLQAKSTFYLAEAGLENGRATLTEGGASVNLSTSLGTAAGTDGIFNFDPDAIQVVLDGNGSVTGFTGYGDDVPLRGPVAMGDGMYIAFLTNDPAEASEPDPRVDVNAMVMVTGVGAGAGRSMEIVQAIIEPDPLLPAIPPCNILMLGDLPDFYGGVGTCTDEDEDEDIDSPQKTFWGTDCAGTGGISGHYVPSLCLQGCGDFNLADEDEDPDPADPLDCSDTVVELVVGSSCTNSYRAGPFFGDDAVADFNDPVGESTLGPAAAIDEQWFDCDDWPRIGDQAQDMADFDCAGGGCSMGAATGWSGGSAPTTTATTITFVNGDLAVPDGYVGHGLLWVTGQLSFHAGASWHGPIMVVGKGEFIRTGISGAGVISGATVVMNTAGPDGTPGNGDDCTSPGPDGFGTAVYYEADGAAGDTMYCTDDIVTANPMWKYELTEFRQR